jgi:hypothetical protein
MKSITREFLAEVGKCTLVHDSIMQNLGIERMGTCAICGHGINNHIGIMTSENQYMYIGSECAKIMTGNNTILLAGESGSSWIDKKNQEMVIISFDDFKKLHIIAHGREFKQGQIDCNIINQFVSNICNYAYDYNFKNNVYALTKKQYDCIKKYL